MISRLDTAGKRINDLEDMSTEMSQTESRIYIKNTYTKTYHKPTAEKQR